MRTNYPGPIADSFEESVKARYFNPAPDSTLVVLIGKDGGIKSRLPDMDLDRLFARIDSMPMRQREMRDADEP